MSDALFKLGALLIKRAEVEGRKLSSFSEEWIRYCEGANEYPLQNPHILCALADCDRFSGNRLSRDVMDWELRAHVQLHEQQQEAA